MRSYIRINSGEAIFPVIGVGCILVSLLIAITLVPLDYAPAGALFSCAAVLTVGMLAVPILRLSIGGVRDSLRAEYFLLVAIIYWVLLDLLQTTYDLNLITKDDVEWAFISIGTMCTGIWVGVLLPTWRLPSVIKRASSVSLGPRALHKAILVSFGLATFNYAFQSGFDPIVIFDGLAAARWSAPWARGDLGGWNSFIEQLQYCGYVLPSLTVMLIKRERFGWFAPRVVVSLILSATFIAFQIQGGGRRIIGVMLGAAILTWLLLSKRISPSKVAVVMLLLWGLLNVMQAILYARSVGIERYLEYGVEESSKKDYFHVDDNFLRLGQIIHYFPDAAEYVGVKQITFVMIRPIPRALWPGKPVDPGFSLPQLLGVQGVSLSSSIIGELYASWGLLAVFAGGVFIGNIANSWNRILSISQADNGRVIFAIGLMVLFAGMRSMQDLVILSYAILAWVFVSIKMGTRETTKSDRAGSL